MTGLLSILMFAATLNGREVATALATRLETLYVDQAAAELIATDLRRRALRGEFDGLDAEGLVNALNASIRSLTSDPHLGVSHSAERIPEPGSGAPAPGAGERMLRAAAAQNFGFEKVERLPGNVGFLELNGFFDPRYCGETAIAAMAFLANSDAIIIDLRYNSGGVPGIGLLLSSYFFDKPVHLHSIEWREAGKTRLEQFWTQAFVPGRRLPDQPLFLLTSDRTISAAESFAYSLQAAGRAVVVGEVTAGGGQPGREVRITEHFAAFMPTGRAVNPITNTNWEGKGIQPDVAVDEEEATATAHRLALEALRDRAPDAMTRARYQSVLDELVPPK
ncbi:MAG TPA: S41 family peptidase [Thermoanaerobaculia bacterium]|nr:S41 family peptidase [Thermoanaerobaculia bacterium]